MKEVVLAAKQLRETKLELEMAIWKKSSVYGHRFLR